MHKIHDAGKHNVSQWKNYWNRPLSSHVRKNLKHNILHDVPKYIRAIHKTSNANTDHRVTPASVIKNNMTSDATLLKMRQTSVLLYDVDTVKNITQEPVINNSMNLEVSYLKKHQ